MTEAHQGDAGKGGSDAAGSRLLSNSKWNLVAFAASLAANFVTIPFVISAIGMREFGTAGLVLAALAPMMLIGVVLGQAALREVAHRFASGELPGASQVFSSALTLCLLASTSVLVLVALAGGTVLGLITKPDPQGTDWHLGLIVATVGWLAQQVVLLLQSTLAAAQKYPTIALISVVATVLNTAAIMIGVTWMPNGLGFLLGTATGFVAALVVWGVLVARELPWLMPLSGMNKLAVRGLLAFGKWQSATHLISSISLQMDRYVLGALAPVAVVGQYNAAMRLQEVVYMPVLKIAEVLFPHFSITAADSVERRTAFYLSASWILNTVAACALAPLIPLAHSVLALWLNPAEATGAAPILRTLAAAGVIGSGMNVFGFLLMGTGQPAVLLKLTAVYSSLAIVLTIWLIYAYGPEWVGVGAVIAGVVRLGLMTSLSRRDFGSAATLGAVVTCTLLPLLCGLVVAWVWYRVGAVSPSTWIALASFYVAIAVSVALASMAATCIHVTGRTHVFNTLRMAQNLILRRS